MEGKKNILLVDSLHTLPKLHREWGSELFVVIINGTLLNWCPIAQFLFHVLIAHTGLAEEDDDVGKDVEERFEVVQKVANRGTTMPVALKHCGGLKSANTLLPIGPV